ncbi:protein naked cuticle homolog 2-like isoform X3 [Lethenteron reissneri]|uniref:protein naked cuticle homolog 2-like isoform X3 n=1 Tax=Lethenteron reissneri TaxID=7753 RepID=UPI002AB7B0C6|nr:protein naked cuticle homolog 2-like isoform X3 [Lethenteron reissneri]
MGKLQSKHAGRRRESPEGDSVAASTSLCRRLEDSGGGSRGRLAGHRGRLTCPDGVKDGYRYLDEECSEVFQKRGEGSSPRSVEEEKLGSLPGPLNSSFKKRLNFNDIAGLMHTIYEVVDNSVNHSPNNSKTLRVKLSVTPDPSQRRRANTDVQGTWAGATGSPDGVGGPDKRNLRRHNSDQNPPANTRHHYCLDENIERRNHYLDLAGIENYTSRFEEDTPENIKQEQQSKATQPHGRSHSQGPESHGPRGSHRPHACDAGAGQGGDAPPPLNRQQGEALASKARTQQQLLLIARSPRVHGKPATAKSGKALRLQSQSVYAPVLASPSELQQQQQHGNKKHRQRSREAHGRYGLAPGPALPLPVAGEGDAYGGAYDAAMPLMQRHEHHHFHEHHHHHHYHHYTET